jgi:magnesium transporter
MRVEKFHATAKKHQFRNYPMLFLSELIDKRVFVDERRYIGRLKDIIFLNGDNPKVTKIIIESDAHRTHEIPIIGLRQTNGHINIVKTLETPINKNELSAIKSLLDQQIIDLVGNKVVRVNDVVIQDTATLSISGIDIGILGIFRRIGIEGIIQSTTRALQFEIPMQLLSWGDIMNLELEQGQIQIKQREEKLAKIHEEDLADYLEMTNIRSVHQFINALSKKKAAEVVESLAVNYQVEVFQHFDQNKSAQLITLIDPDEAVDILLALDRAKRDKIMHLLDDVKQAELHRLMTFSRTPVGKLMTSEFFAVPSNLTASEIQKEIKKQTSDFSSLGAIYILNRDDQLVGVCNLHELLLQDSNAPAYKFMVPEPIVVLLTTPIEVVIYKMLKYNISSLPIINRDKHILGIITIDDVSDILIKKIQ